MGSRKVQHGVVDAPERAPSRVADQFVNRLAEAGVERVFGIPGGAISPLYDALIDVDIEPIVCQHEGMAMYLAYGYARATGRPGVVMVTSGPGILNCATGLGAARLDEVPLVVVAGDVKSDMAGRGALQDGSVQGLDISSVVRPLAKAVEVIARPGRTLASLHQAFDTAMAHPRGPVVLELPMDLASAAARPSRIVSQIDTQPVARADVRAQIVDGLATALRPAIFLGLGARLAGVGPAVLRLAERMRCPVITDIEAKGTFPEAHALSLGLFGVGSRGTAERYLGEGVDFLLTVGARLDDTTTGGFSEVMRPEGTVVQIDHDAARLNRSLEYDLGVVCDLRGTLETIGRVASPPSPHLLLNRDAAVQAARRMTITEVPPSMGTGPHHPASVIRALQASLPSDTVFTTDIGNHLIFAAQNLVLDGPDRFHVSIGLGGMSSGIGTAMGLAAHHGQDRPVVGICGDGSFRMAGAEIATCAAHGIPVVLAVLNDGQLGMVEHGNGKVFGRSDFCHSPAVDIAAHARALGATAVRVDRVGDLERAVEHIGHDPLVLEFPTRADVQAANPRAEIFAFPNDER